MIQLKNRGHPPWFARGEPQIKLCDGPFVKIRGKPPFAIRGRPRGKLSFLTVISTTKEERSVTTKEGYSRFLTMLEMTKNTVFFRGKNCLYSQWSAFLWN